jgi:hypothetical protein
MAQFYAFEALRFSNRKTRSETRNDLMVLVILGPCFVNEEEKILKKTQN